MEGIIALARTLDLLVSIRHEHDPTIGDLLAAVPDLRKMDWINRFGEGSLVQLRAVQGCQRLCLIAGDISLPLEAIPPSLIVECFDVAHVLENETREALLRHIDRRQRRVWKSLRRVRVS